MAIVIQIVTVAALVAVVMWMTAVYGRRGIRKQEKSDKLESSGMQQYDQQDMERMKDRVASHKQTKVLKSKLAFLGDVLAEVQRLNNSMSSYLKVLTTADLKPG